MDYEKMFEKYKTPFYLYDMRSLSAQLEKISAALDGIKTCYCMKASPILAPLLHEKVDRIEVCSPGEYEIAMRGGCPADKIFFSGVNKTTDSVSRVIDTAGADCTYTIESESHYEIIDSVAAKWGIVADCYVRLSSGNQFGVDEEEFLRLVKLVEESENLNFVGIHFFSGTQKKPKKIAKELKYLVEFSEKIKEIAGDDIALEYGPGLGVDYFLSSEGEDLFDSTMETQLEEVAAAVAESGVKEAFSDVTFEHGRFIAACGAEYFTKIIDIKNTKGTDYAILDGGLHQLNYFGSMAGMKTPCIEVVGADGPAEKEYVLAGSLCSVNDILARSAKLPELSKDDVLKFRHAGAYSTTESIGLFLSRDIPKIVLKDEDGQTRVLRNSLETNLVNDGTFFKYLNFEKGDEGWTD